MAVTAVVFTERTLHADALPCLAVLRSSGLRLGAAGNMHAVHEDFSLGALPEVLARV